MLQAKGLIGEFSKERIKILVRKGAHVSADGAGQRGKAREETAIAADASGRVRYRRGRIPGLVNLVGGCPAAAVRYTSAPALALLRAAVVLAVVGTAGCSVFAAPSAPSGMEKQITQGEQAGAATRAHAPRTGQHAKGKASLSSAQRPVPGRDVTAIGDSVMSASAMTMASMIPGIYIDARPDRQMPTGLAIVRHLAQTGQLRPVVVMGLGTNYIVTTAQLNTLMKLIGPHRKLVLINTYVQDGWSKQVNATDAAYVRAHPNVVLADWYDTIKDRLYLLWPDHTHPMMPGTYVYARLVKQAIQDTREVPSSNPHAQPVVAVRAVATPHS
jgi:hypothetical protein